MIKTHSIDSFSKLHCSCFFSFYFFTNHKPEEVIVSIDTIDTVVSIDTIDTIDT